MRLHPVLNGLALLLAGCAGGGVGAEGRYPSLAKRPIESRDFDAELRARDAAVADAGQAVADPALADRIEKLGDDVRAGAAAFDDAYAGAAAAVSRAGGSAVASDAWSEAQVALSALDGRRHQSVSALAALDQLYIERLNAIADGEAVGGEAEIQAARNAALSIVDSQNDRMDALRARLATP